MQIPGTMIHHAGRQAASVLALSVAVVGSTLEAIAVASTGLSHRRLAHRRPASRRAVALAVVTAPAEEEHLSALGVPAHHVAQRLAEGLSHRFARNWTSRSWRASSSPLGGKNELGLDLVSRPFFPWLISFKL
jgi:hypothetical protein